MSLPIITNNSAHDNIINAREEIKQHSLNTFNNTSKQYEVIIKSMLHELKDASRSTNTDRIEKLKTIEYLKTAIDSNINDEKEKAELIKMYDSTVATLKQNTNNFEKMSNSLIKNIGNITGVVSTLFSNMPPIMNIVATRAGDFISNKIQERKEKKERERELSERIATAIRDVNNSNPPRPETPELVGPPRPTSQPPQPINENRSEYNGVSQSDIDNQNNNSNNSNTKFLKSSMTMLSTIMSKTFSVVSKGATSIFKTALLIPLISLAFYAYDKIVEKWGSFGEFITDMLGKAWDLIGKEIVLFFLAVLSGKYLFKFLAKSILSIGKHIGKLLFSSILAGISGISTKIGNMFNKNITPTTNIENKNKDKNKKTSGPTDTENKNKKPNSLTDAKNTITKSQPTPKYQSSVYKGMGKGAGAAGIVWSANDMYNSYKEGDYKSVVSEGYGAAGGAGGALLGAQLGLLAGPAAPVAVPVGALLGGITGYIAGTEIGKSIFDIFTNKKPPKVFTTNDPNQSNELLKQRTGLSTDELLETLGIEKNKNLQQNIKPSNIITNIQSTPVVNNITNVTNNNSSNNTHVVQTLSDSSGTIAHGQR